MTQPPFKMSGAFRVVGYLILGFAVAQGILDMVASSAPILPDLLAWRLKAEGIAASGWTMSAVMILLMGVFALAYEDRKVLLTLAVTSGVLAILLLATSGLFALDAIQMGRQIPAADKTTYMISAAYAMAKLGIGIVALSLLAWTTSKAARSLRRASAGSARQGVMIGTAGAPST